jgi:hypothetical protein
MGPKHAACIDACPLYKKNNGASEDEKDKQKTKDHRIHRKPHCGDTRHAINELS